MRRFLLLAFLTAALLVPASTGAEPSPWPPTNHSPNVVGVSWTPREPARGEDVDVEVQLRPNASVANVILRVCRVQAYACRAPIAMADANGSEGQTLYRATNDWSAAFFDHVTQVGVAVILQTDESGSPPEESPLENWPETPADLPDGAGRYYFYDLPAQAHDAPSAAVGALAAALALAALAWQRRR